MSVKLHFLRSHLNYFPKNYEDLSEEQSERFHQESCTIDEHYKGRWDVNFLAAYWWCLKRDAMAAEHRESTWIDLTSMNSFFCVFFSLLWHNVSFLWIYIP